MSIRIITITVSDTRTTETDTAGRALMEELAAFELVRHVIVPDEPMQIRRAVLMGVAEADAIVLCGGTGISPRDHTFEAVCTLFEKKLDGFGETFRRLSWDEIGPRSLLSRAAAGTIDKSIVFLLPGSEKAARLGARALVAPIVAHAVEQLNGRPDHAQQPASHR